MSDSRVIRYLALGDSFTIGTGTSPDLSFPARLVRLWSARGRTVTLRNPAVNGYTTGDLIADELPVVRDFAPDVITVLIGGNDIVRGWSEDRYRAQLRHIYQRLRADAPEAALYGLPQPDWSLSSAASAFGDPRAFGSTIERFNGIAKEEVERAGGMYLDIFPLTREQAKRGMFAADGLHPSAAAYAEWAEALRDRVSLRSSPRWE